jgi:hypothetical protein
MIVLLQSIPFDLHVLGLPLALILSQDQTLHCKVFNIALGLPVCPNSPKGTELACYFLQSFKERFYISNVNDFDANRI